MKSTNVESQRLRLETRAYWIGLAQKNSTDSGSPYLATMQRPFYPVRPSCDNARTIVLALPPQLRHGARAFYLAAVGDFEKNQNRRRDRPAAVFIAASRRPSDANAAPEVG